jgi:hypothetical protein
MQVACWPLEWYRGGLRDEDLPRTARAGLWMISGGMASVFVGGLLKTACLHICRGCRELAVAPTALLGFGPRPEHQCSQLSRGGITGSGWYPSCCDWHVFGNFDDAQALQLSSARVLSCRGAHSAASCRSTRRISAILS